MEELTHPIPERGNGETGDTFPSFTDSDLTDETRI